MMKFVFACLSLILSASANAAEVKLGKIDNPMRVVEQIRQNPDNYFVAQFTGMMDAKMREATRHTGETIVAGMRIRKYSDMCDRIAMSFITKDTPTKDGKKIDWWTRIEFDYCADGSIPPPNLDLADIARKITPQR